MNEIVHYSPKLAMTGPAEIACGAEDLVGVTKTDIMKLATCGACKASGLKVKDIPVGKVTKAVVQNWLREHGYEEDRWGHFQKDSKDVASHSGGKTQRYRYKLSNVLARKEVRVGEGDNASWMRLRSGYYNSLSINAAGQLIGMNARY